MAITKFADLIGTLDKLSLPRRIAVVAAEDGHTLEAIMRAEKDRIASPVLIGDETAIRALLAELGHSAAAVRIVRAADPAAAAREAVRLIHAQEADIIMKGRIETATLMKVIVDKTSNLRTGRIMSHLAFFEVPAYHKLLAVTDVAINIRPDLAQKRQLIENAVPVLARMGIARPKVAALAAAEEVNPKIADSLDALELKKMNLAGEITGCVIEGPISYDLAISREAARIKRYASPVAGDADLLVVPDLTAGNLLAKALVYSGGAKMAGFVVGAKVPIILTSRSATTEDKYLSTVLAAAACSE